MIPSKLTDTILVSGTVLGARAGAAPQPMGDATHCGKPGYAPCWTWTGKANIVLKRVPAKLKLVASAPGPVQPSTQVTFTATTDPDTISHMKVPMSFQTWAWFSSAIMAGDTIACTSTTATTCTRTMLRSGTMYSTAFVNGREEEAWLPITVAGFTPPPPLSCRDALTIAGPAPNPGTPPHNWGAAGDSVKNKYPPLASPAADSLFKQLWQGANYSPELDWNLRKERLGYIIPGPDGTFAQKEVHPSLTAPCMVAGFGALPPDMLVLVHTHPNALGDDLAPMCGSNTWPNYYAGVPSVEDDLVLAFRVPNPNAIGAILDADGITIYNPNNSTYVRIQRCGY